MKYIRTKDGRIIETPFMTDLDKPYRFADTIEELCDEFVAYHKTLKLTYCIKRTPFNKQDENFNIYGAIWTEWGLKYVAKMNEKGELELL